MRQYARGGQPSLRVDKHASYLRLSQDGDFVVLEFQHDGWDENNRFYAFCNFQWALALEKLKRACETQSQP